MNLDQVNQEISQLETRLAYLYGQKRLLTGQKPQGLGAKMRQIADSLKAEDEIQKKATARILAASAKIAINYDRLVDETVEALTD